jgi:hypothetical protein
MHKSLSRNKRSKHAMRLRYTAPSCLTYYVDSALHPATLPACSNPEDHVGRQASYPLQTSQHVTKKETNEAQFEEQQGIIIVLSTESTQYIKSQSEAKRKQQKTSPIPPSTCQSQTQPASSKKSGSSSRGIILVRPNISLQYSLQPQRASEYRSCKENKTKRGNKRVLNM